MKKEKQEPATPVTNTAEVAAALGITGRAVAKRAAKGGWSSIGRACPGGALYDLNTLPGAVRLAIVKRRMLKGGWRRRLAHYLHRLAWWIDGVQS